MLLGSNAANELGASPQDFAFAVDLLFVGLLVSYGNGESNANLSPRGVWVLIVHRPNGAKVKITVLRAGKTITAEVTLGPTL